MSNDLQKKLQQQAEKNTQAKEDLKTAAQADSTEEGDVVVKLELPPVEELAEPIKLEKGFYAYSFAMGMFTSTGKRIKSEGMQYFPENEEEVEVLREQASRGYLFEVEE